MTFFYPESKRMSNLNGIVIIGGRPDIYEAYHTTRMITPYLESLLLDKHQISHQETIATIDETLHQVANPIKIRGVEEILERTQAKSGKELRTFFPYLSAGTDDASLVLPHNFRVDGVFMMGIAGSFFSSTAIGTGIETIRVYRRSGSELSPSLAFPLIFKWQPVYNDILKQLKSDQSMLPPGYEGYLIPSVVIFQRHESREMTALITSIEEYQGQLYYHVAVANSGAADGQPLSLLQAALSREKFGQPAWVDRLDQQYIPDESQQDQIYAEDLISTELNLVVPETELQTEGEFDLGKLRAL